MAEQPEADIATNTNEAAPAQVTGIGQRWYERFSPWKCAGVAMAVIAGTGLIELAMGRVPICKCGYVKLWQGVVHSPENSQHISDWYSFSHIIHGFFFFFVLWLIARRWPVSMRAVVAVGVEALWEITENTPMVIDRYRHATFALHYYGDSVVNSVSDILFMVLGFMLASRLPVWMTIALTIVLEGVAAYFIRDNLTLNIIMLLYPVEAIRVWQAGG